MRLTASDIISLYRPTPCDLRIYLREHRIPEGEPSAFEQLLQTLGQRHEEEHLDTLGAYEDPSLFRPEERVQRTTEAIRNRVPVIYQGELAKDTALNGISVTLIGRPDFLIWDADGYLIRDSKLSRHVDEDHHIEIALQVQLYGWPFEQTVHGTVFGQHWHLRGRRDRHLGGKWPSRRGFGSLSEFRRGWNGPRLRVGLGAALG
jgi:predicted RecB family nuclease